MNTQIYIVLAVFIAFVVMILSGKVKIHVAALTIPVLLEVTGVLKFNDAWGGLTNSSIVMMAAMFVVGEGVSKTNIISKLSKTVIKPGANDFFIMIGIFIPTFFLTCVVNATATITIMLPMITAICAEHRRALSKFVFPAAVSAQLWAGAIPTGGNAAGYLARNTEITNLGGVGTYTFFTSLISKIPMLIVITGLLMFVSIKISPDNGNIPGLEGVDASAGLNKVTSKKKGHLTPIQEKIMIAIFALTILGIIGCAIEKVNTWYPALFGALATVFSGILSDKDAIRSMGNPVIFITVGTLPLSKALAVSGADKVLADLFNKMTGGMSPFGVMISMYLVCCALTHFVTNSSVNNTFRPLSILIAVQNGWNPVALMLAVTLGSANCYMTPMAAPAMTLGYEAGEYTSKQYLKQGLILSIAHFICFALWVPLMFPLV